MKVNQAAKSPNYELVKCKNCGIKFNRKISGANRRLPNGVRARNTVNCSPRCTKIWRDKMEGKI